MRSRSESTSAAYTSVCGRACTTACPSGSSAVPSDVFGLAPDDACGMLEELKDALGMYCPDGEHLRRVG
ncbi:hypothetical protein [Methermicoccus shengliensis]|uniref:Uncharacterized protein n=1 Tax=Methermicoccus shengliensis TaxID=660064 RepID=A0A832W0I4_9EURY|nr:hypothetical protein [Methermicoccus shengliensis]HIH70414.1 hypothetical protein [Methermicoccus shengliensis]